jgi:hypothetical protein
MIVARALRRASANCEVGFSISMSAGMCCRAASGCRDQRQTELFLDLLGVIMPVTISS